MKTAIYYFTGTGNSLYVAQGLAQELDASLEPIPPLMEQERIMPEADTVGIVFPVYINTLPVMVRRFAEKLHAQGKYVFALPTFGGAAGMSYRAMDTALAQNGGELSAGFGVHMPQNAFHKPWDNPSRIYAKWERKLPRIAARIRAQKRGIVHGNALLEWALRGLSPKLQAAYQKSLSAATGMDINADPDDMIAAMGKTFSVGAQCNGCGVCASVCPAGNIVLSDGKPTWRNRCETCLACVNWCPQLVISGGMAQGDFKFKNAHITLKQMQAQAKGN